MKEEEFNDFLRNRADSFELKPSSGSFDEVARKLNKEKKRKGIILFLFPLLLLAGISTGYYFTRSTSNEAITALGYEEVATQIETSPKKQLPSSLSANNEVESTITPNTPKETLMLQDSEISKSVVNGNDTRGNRQSNNVSQKTKTTDTKQVRIANTDEKPNNVSQNSIVATIIDEGDNEDNSTTVLTKEETNENAKPEESTIAINTDALQPIVKKAEKEGNIPSLENRPDIGGCATCLTKKWTLRAYYNPFSMNYYKGNRDISSNESISAPPLAGTSVSYERSFIKENLNGKSNFGINLEYRLAKRLSIGSGIGLSKWSSEVGEWTVLYSKNIVNVYSLDTPTNTLILKDTQEVFSESTSDTNSYTNDVTSVQIPLYFNLSLLQKPRFSLDARVGVVANYTRNVTTIKDPKQPTRVNFNAAVDPKVFYNNFNLNFSTGLYANYTIGKCWGIYLGPRFGASITGIHKNEKFEYSKPYNWGIETGIKINF